MPRRDPQSKAGVEAEIHKQLLRFGVGEDGRDWVLRALHPAGEHRIAGLPDQSATDVVRPEYRVQFTIQAPAGAGSWDLFTWSPPGDVNALFWATGPAGTNFASPIRPPATEMGVLRLQDVVEGNFPIGYVAIPNTAPSPTVIGVSLMSVGQPTAFRHMYKSITYHQIASAVSDTGQVYACQINGNIRTGPMGGFENAVPSTYDRYVCRKDLAVLPASEAMMSAMAPGFYMGPARDGVYIPHHLTGPTQPFARTVNPTDIMLDAQTTVMYPNTLSFRVPVGAMLFPSTLGSTLANLVPWVFQLDNWIPGGVNVPAGFDTGYDNTAIGVTIWRGLAGSGGFPTSIQVKVVVGLEIVPSPTAPDRIFVEPPAPYEPRALEAYYAINCLIGDAFPANFNGFGELLDVIKSAASKLWDVVSPGLKQAATQLTPALTQAALRAISARTGGAVGAGLKQMALTGARSARVKYTPASIAGSVRKFGAGGGGVRKRKVKR